MNILRFLIVVMVLALARPAWASGYLLTYESGKLSPTDGMAGVKGAKRLKITWSIPSLPSPGKCSAPFEWKTTIISYTDGKNTMASLLEKYVYDNNASPDVTICLKGDGEISQESSFILILFTNLKQINYGEYESFHSTDPYGRNAILSVSKYKHSQLQTTSEDESRGGKFALSPQ